MPDILFVQNYYEHMISIMQLSAVLKQHGYTTDVTLGTRQHIIDEAVAKRPRLLGFYCTTGIHHKYLDVAVEVKKKLGDQVITVFGGPHPTFVPEIIKQDGVDVICRGEGEYALLELLQALDNGREYTAIKNLWVKKDGRIYENGFRPLCDINRLPFPDRDIYKNIAFIHKQKRQEVMFGRGCPFNCTFCSTHAYKELYRGKGEYVRFRDIPLVMEELEYLKHTYRPTCFFFHDDTLVHKRRMEYCRGFLSAYKEKIGLPFSCLVRADLINEELIGLLKDAGCYFLSFGIESGNEDLRNMLLKKQLKDESIELCAELLHKYRIPFATFNIVGFPGETIREVWDTVNLNIRVKPSWAWFSVYQTLPCTELAHYAQEKGYVAHADVDQSDATFHESSIIIKNNPEGKKILRLKNMANLMIKLPFMKKPVSRFFLSVPADFIWSTIDKILYFVFYYSRLTYRQGVYRTASSALFLARRLKEFQ